MASDWHEDVGFLPLARGGRTLLRLVEIEVCVYLWRGSTAGGC